MIAGIGLGAGRIVLGRRRQAQTHRRTSEIPDQNAVECKVPVAVPAGTAACRGDPALKNVEIVAAFGIAEPQSIQVAPQSPEDVACGHMVAVADIEVRQKGKQGEPGVVGVAFERFGGQRQKFEKRRIGIVGRQPFAEIQDSATSVPTAVL